jgi:hypothetical protein
MALCAFKLLYSSRPAGYKVPCQCNTAGLVLKICSIRFNSTLNGLKINVPVFKKRNWASMGVLSQSPYKPILNWLQIWDLLVETYGDSILAFLVFVFKLLTENRLQNTVFTNIRIINIKNSKYRQTNLKCKSRHIFLHCLTCNLNKKHYNSTFYIHKKINAVLEQVK